VRGARAGGGFSIAEGQGHRKFGTNRFQKASAVFLKSGLVFAAAAKRRSPLTWLLVAGWLLMMLSLLGCGWILTLRHAKWHRHKRNLGSFLNE